MKQPILEASADAGSTASPPSSQDGSLVPLCRVGRRNLVPSSEACASLADTTAARAGAHDP